MFISPLIKTVATVTVVGSVLAVAQVAVPAAEMATTQSKSAAAGCTYPSSTTTTTRLTLRRTIGQYGAYNKASVNVIANGNTGATPRGSARFTIAGDTYTAQLSGGSAAVDLPTLSAGSTYRVRAAYRPRSCSKFKASSSETKFYTVKKATTNSSLRVRDISSGERPRVQVGVTARTGMNVRNGSVALRLLKNGNLMQTRSAEVNNGQANATFGRVSRRGTWVVKVVYSGAANFTGSREAIEFRVTR